MVTMELEVYPALMETLDNPVTPDLLVIEEHREYLETPDSLEHQVHTLIVKSRFV